MSSTKINLNQLDGNVYTEDNLVGGNNISLTDKIISGGIDEDTIMMLHFDSNLTDSSQYSSTLSSSIDYTDRTSYVDGKFNKCFRIGKWGTGVRLNNQNAVFQEFSGDITLDFWHRFNNSSKQYTMFDVQSKYVSGYNKTPIYFCLERGEYGTYKLYIYNSASQYAATIELEDYINTSDFNHYAVTFDHTTSKVRFFINGVTVYNDIVNDISYNYSAGFYSGNFEGNGNYDNSIVDIDEYRISKCLRWESDFSDNLPDKPYSSDSTTVKAINSNNSVQSIDVKTMLALSQTAYDALTTKDPNTFYVIVEDSDESL